MTMEALEYWHWLALGFGLLVLEMLLPTGFILLWVGIAAVIVGLLSWMIPSMGWQPEFVLWGVLSVVTVLAWRRFRPLPAQTGEQPTLNRRGASYVGREFTLGSEGDEVFFALTGRDSGPEMAGLLDGRPELIQLTPLGGKGLAL